MDHIGIDSGGKDSQVCPRRRGGHHRGFSSSDHRAGPVVGESNSGARGNGDLHRAFRLPGVALRAH